jgi:hypothetical protein
MVQRPMCTLCRCKAYVAADKSTQFEVAPNVLQICLKRFMVGDSCAHRHGRGSPRHAHIVSCSMVTFGNSSPAPAAVALLCTLRLSLAAHVSACPGTAVPAAAPWHSAAHLPLPPPTSRPAQVGRFGGKNKSHISFPEQLDLEPYMAEDCLDERPAQYSLYGVVVHQGFTASFGGWRGTGWGVHAARAAAARRLAMPDISCCFRACQGMSQVLCLGWV